MKISHIIILSTVLFYGTGCNKGNTEEMGNGLIIEDLVVGEGAEARSVIDSRLVVVAVVILVILHREQFRLREVTKGKGVIVTSWNTTAVSFRRF